MLRATTYKIPRSVLVVIHTPALEVLLIRRSDVGTWQSVTGSKAGPRETYRRTAEREVLEETGIACGPGTALADRLRDWRLVNRYDIYPRYLHRYAPGVTRNTEHVFGLTLPGRCAVRLDPREHTDCCWLPWREAADRCFSPSNAEAILWLPRFVPAADPEHRDV